MKTIVDRSRFKRAHRRELGLLDDAEQRAEIEQKCAQKHVETCFSILKFGGIWPDDGAVTAGEGRLKTTIFGSLPTHGVEAWDGCEI